MADKLLIYDAIIIGGGVSGFSAAMYSARLGLKVLVIAELLGGTVTMAGNIENYPGFESISGFELAEKIRKHAMKYPVKLEEDSVIDIEKTEKGLFKVTTSSSKFNSKAIIYSTGTKWRELNAKREKEFTNKGVHYCALCDCGFYRDKIVAVVGGSDAAVKEAILLAGLAKKVYIIYRGDRLRAESVVAQKAIANKKITVIYKTNIKEFYGEKKLQGVVLDNKYKNSLRLELDGVFIAIGHEVLSDLAKKLGVALNKKSEIIVDKEARTNVKGFFASGDVTDLSFKQAITGVAQGVLAAHSAFEYIKKYDVEQ